MKPKTPPPVPSAHPKRKPGICVYAPLGEDYSYATVAKAWIRHLQSRHALVVPVDIFNADAFGPPSRDDLGIAFGPTPLCEKVLRRHKRRILHLVPDSSRVPQEWVELGDRYNAVVTPSVFGRDSLVDSGLKKSKITLIRHGADPTCLFPRDPPGLGFLHATTSTTYWDRKGTPMLLKAWKTFVEVGGWATQDEYSVPKLTVLVPPRTHVPKEFEETPHTTIEVAPSRSPERWGRYLSTFEAVLCPSRGEGFGMIPVEARLCGVVPILTACTGHAEHFNPVTDIHVEHGPPEACWGHGLAPKVAVYSIEEALLNYLRNGRGKRAELLRRREDLAKAWSWSTVLRPLDDLVEDLL
jgi:glycosyltransferase involved in cell wall biosynthesis